MADPTILIAFSAGLGSFIAPCILPMIPAFLAYISGTTLNEIKHNQKNNFQINKVSIIANTIFFVLGFSVVFSTLGVLINSILSNSVTQFLGDLNSIAGIIIIIFGIFLLLSQKINFINKEKRDPLNLQYEIASRINTHCQNLGLIVRPLFNTCVMSPSLIIEEGEIDELVRILREGIMLATEDIKKEGLWS